MHSFVDDSSRRDGHDRRCIRCDVVCRWHVCAHCAPVLLDVSGTDAPRAAPRAVVVPRVTVPDIERGILVLSP